MPDFLQVIDEIQAEASHVVESFNTLYNKEDEGFHRVGGKGRRSPEHEYKYNKMLLEAVQLFEDVMTGRRRPWVLQEALSTSDFPQLFGDILDRQLLGNFRAWPVTYPNYVRVKAVRDFRTVKRLFVDGGEGTLDVVPQGTNYPGDFLADGEYTYAVKKYGRRMPFNWETLINDDLDALTDVPERFGKAAARTREKFATELFVDSTGPHASFYTGGNANIVTGNPILGVEGLQTAMTILAAQTDADSEPIMVDAVHLVIPPALMVQANNLKNALQIEATNLGGSTNQKLIVSNWLAGLQIHVNAYIPIVASSSNGSTSWFLFGDPGGTRPAVEVGTLRGHEEPEIFMKSPNAVRVGGGSIDPMAGDFDSDAIQYKVRDVIGGTRMSPKVTVASNGSAS